MSVTLSLAYSMRKMTATINLVRRMHATETSAGDGHLLGQNGTHTLNQMRIRDVQFPALGHRQSRVNWKPRSSG